MDRTAIERIEELTAARLTIAEYIPAAILPCGMDVKSLEHLQEAPAHQRATYTTERLEDFCNYIKQESLTESQTAVFVKPDGSGAEGIIDFGSHVAPLWGHHRAQLAMKYTPEFQSLLNACSRDLSQRDLIDWLEDWHHIISPFSSFDGDGTTLSIPQAIQKLQRIDIKASASKSTAVGDFNAQQTTMEQIEAKSGDGAPPAGFGVTLQVYPCTKSRDVRARLSIKTGGDKPVFRLRIMGEDALRKDVAEEIDLEIITRLSGTDARTFVGSVKKG